MKESRMKESRIKSKLFTGIASLLLTAGLQATPTPYASQFGALKLENPTSATLLRDNLDASKVWVLPPKTGEMNIKGFQASGNIGFCDGLKHLYRGTGQTAKRISQIVEQVSAMNAQQAAKQKKVDQAREMLGELQSNPSAVKMLQLDSQLEAINDQFAEITDKLDSCTTGCEAFLEAYKELRQEAKELRSEMRQLRQTDREIFSQVSKAENRLKQAEIIALEVLEPYNRMAEVLNKFRDRLFSMYSNEAKLEGGFISMDYETKWSDAVRVLQEKYPQFGFQKILTQDVRVNTHPIATAGSSIEDYYNSLPMILSYSVAGLPFLSNGEIKNELMDIPETVAGDYRMSLIGACPRAVTDFFDGLEVSPELGTDGLPKYALTLSYNFPVSFKYKVNASYNMFKMYELIKKSSSKGGFFSTKSYSSVQESEVSDEAFKIDWTTEDPSDSLSPKERTTIANSFKGILLDRILQAMASPVYTESPAKPLDAEVPLENGAIVLGKGLSKVCPLNIYCKVGGWILKGIGSAFGSSSSESRFKTETNITARETWSSEMSIFKPGIATFAR